MRSSSVYFPVRLVSAEIRNRMNEDVYLLKHNRDSDKSVELALTRISKEGSITQRPPIILVHGAFASRLFWLANGKPDFVETLVAKGFDVWLVEWRGHGMSPVNREFLDNEIRDLIAYDLPAAVDFVKEQTGQAPKWIGHDTGGFALLSAVANGFIDSSDVASLSILYSPDHAVRCQLTHSLFSKASKWRWRSKGAVSGIKFDLGTENESYRSVRDIVKFEQFNLVGDRNLWGDLQSDACGQLSVQLIEINSLKTQGRSAQLPVSASVLFKNAKFKVQHCLYLDGLASESLDSHLDNVHRYHKAFSHLTAWAKGEFSFCLSDSHKDSLQIA